MVQSPCQETPPAAGHIAEVNGMQMYYETYGAGEPLVLLHGFTGSGGHWKEDVEELSQHYRLIIPDMRGHGRSTNPVEEFTHRQSAKDIYALLDQLGIEKFKACGISSGGMTLLHMATSQSDRIRAMVLIGATHYFPEQARKVMRASTPESMSAKQMEEPRKIHRHGDEQILKLARQFHAFKDSYDDMNFTRPFLSTITARTLIIHGDRDEFFPIEIPVELYTSIPHSQLWIIPNGGHVPHHNKHVPFMETVLDFLAEPKSMP